MPTPPDVLFIRFTENVEHEHTHAEVFDENGTRVDREEVIFDDEKRNEILVPLRNLTDGIYTVRWYSLSVDTHTTEGTYLFAVGSASLSGATPPTSGHVHGEEGLPVWVESFGRALHYAAAAAAVGVPLFLLAIARTPSTLNLSTMGRVLVVTAIGGITGAAIVLFAFSQRIESSVLDALSWQGLNVASLLTWRLTLQALLFVTAVTFLVFAKRGMRAVRSISFLLIALGAALVLLTSLSSHAASVSQNRGLTIAADVVHLFAGSVWVGGVAAFLLLFRSEPRETLALWINRFSPIALVCVGTILLTGVYASVLHLNHPLDLFAGAYGAMILVKALLILPLLLIGGFNRYVAKRRLVAGTEWRSTNLRRALVLETSLMALVLVAAGVLATSAPPSADMDVPGPTSVVLEKELEDAHMILTISPAPLRVGVHNYSVELHSFVGGNPPGSVVYLQFTPPNGGKLPEIHEMKRVSPDRWTLDGGFMTQRGEWTVHVTAQTQSREATSFQVQIG